MTLLMRFRFWVEIHIHLLIGVTLTGLIAFLIYSENPSQIFTNQINLAGDGAFQGFHFKLLKESNFIDVLLQNINSSQYGWPYNSNFTYYPTGNLIEIFFIKIMFTINSQLQPANIIHAFSILKSIVIFVTSYWALNRIGISKALSVVGALLFTFNLFNLIRSEGHFWLGMTWSVPIGLYCLITFYKIYFSQNLKLNARLTIFVVLGLLVGLSTIYYAFFFLFLSFMILFLGIINSSILVKYELSRLVLKNFVYKYVRDYKLVLIFVLGILSGLMMQLLPVIIRLNRTILLASSSERNSWTEHFIYGGTFDSLFFDTNRFLISVFANRPDIVNFLVSRNSWEASQTGALTGLVLYILILIGVINFSRNTYLKSFKLSLDPLNKSLLILLLFAFLMYFPTLVRLGLWEIIPNIRVYGRFTIIISFICIALALYNIQIIFRKKLMVYLACIITLSPGVVEAYGFNKSRPSSDYTNSIAVNITNQRTETLSNLQKIIPDNCSITIVPISPFPEFDNPEDKNIDYAAFDLILIDNYRFKWGIGVFKNTYENRLYENLYSQFPNFARADLEFTLNYLNSASMCGAIIDRTLLVESEEYQFQSLQHKNKNLLKPCLIDLKGETYQDMSRYFLYNFLDKNCRLNNYVVANNLYESFNSSKILWRNDTLYGIKFENGKQIFKAKDEISLRLVPTENIKHLEFIIDTYPIVENFQIYLKSESGQISYPTINIDDKGRKKIFYFKTFLKGERYKFKFGIKGASKDFNYWSIQPAAN